MKLKAHLPRENGRPVHGTKRGVENFYRWFNGSAVVNDEGCPLVLYHGTSADITTFEISAQGELGAGIYLTSDPEDAGEYAGDENACTMPVFVQLRRPIFVDAETAWADIVEIATGSPPDEDLEPDEHESAAIMAALLSLCHDGIISTSLGGPTHYVVFCPTQIKSALGNDGSFSASDPSLIGRSHPTLRARRPVTRAELIAQAAAENYDQPNSNARRPARCPGSA